MAFTNSTQTPMPTGEKSNFTCELLSAATGTGAGSAFRMHGNYFTFQAYGSTSAGSGAASIDIEVSNLDSPTAGTSVHWTKAGTISLTLGTTVTNDAFALDAPYLWVRAKVASISGTDASVNCYMGARG